MKRVWMFFTAAVSGEKHAGSTGQGRARSCPDHNQLHAGAAPLIVPPLTLVGVLGLDAAGLIAHAVLAILRGGARRDRVSDERLGGAAVVGAGVDGAAARQQTLAGCRFKRLHSTRAAPTLHLILATVWMSIRAPLALALVSSRSSVWPLRTSCGGWQRQAGRQQARLAGSRR